MNDREKFLDASDAREARREENRERLAAWSARCDCRNNHASASGRCNNRDVTDPTHKPGEVVYCDTCRRHCAPSSTTVTGAHNVTGRQ